MFYLKNVDNVPEFCIKEVKSFATIDVAFTRDALGTITPCVMLAQRNV